MDTWTTKAVEDIASKAGLNATVFGEHDINGAALHEMDIQYEHSMKIPAVVDEAGGEKFGPKLRFLHMLRRWAKSSTEPAPQRPAAPPPPFPPDPPFPPPPAA